MQYQYTSSTIRKVVWNHSILTDTLWNSLHNTFSNSICLLLPYLWKDINKCMCIDLWTSESNCISQKPIFNGQINYIYRLFQDNNSSKEDFAF